MKAIIEKITGLLPNMYKTISSIIGLIPIGAVFGIAAYTAKIEIRDLDLWLHIGMGRFMTINKVLPPSVDMLSCSIAGTPWINHEWLFQIIVYNMFSNEVYHLSIY